MIETLLIITLGLLVFACLVGLRILSKLSQMNSGIALLNQVTATLGDLKANNDRETFEEIRSYLEKTCENTKAIEQNTSEIKFVTDIIYKYKLPNSSEQELLDRIEIDNEFQNGIQRKR
jgi:hypothetical protein